MLLKNVFATGSDVEQAHIYRRTIWYFSLSDRYFHIIINKRVTNYHANKKTYEFY